MEIEILTTKRKLTKLIIKQLEPATSGDMQAFTDSSANLGFYVMDIGKGYTQRVGLLQGTGGIWKSLQIRNWARDGDCCMIRVANYGLARSFGSEEIRDKWLESYNETKKKLLQNHVII